MATRFFTPGIGCRSGIGCGAGLGGISRIPQFNGKCRQPVACWYQEGAKRHAGGSYRGAVAFLVFFARATGTRIVAANFGSDTHRLGSLSLRWPGLIL